MFSVGFAHPAVLLLLVVPIALLAWVWRRAGRRLSLPFDHGRQAPGNVWRVAIGLAESLPALVLAVVVLILAGPQRLSEPRTKRTLTNIEFCVDISGSMTATFGGGTRYDASMEAITDFLDQRQGDAFGLTFFGNSVLHWVPLTSDASAVRCAPPFMKPSQVPPWFGGTEIGKALLACKEVLSRREEGDRMVILVSDGFSADLFAGKDEEIARELKDENIAVFAIHVADTEVPPPIATITGLTGGEIFSPSDPEGLKGVFLKIDSMKRAKLEKSAPEVLDNFPPFCAAALGLLGLGGLSLLGLRYTPW